MNYLSKSQKQHLNIEKRQEASLRKPQTVPLQQHIPVMQENDSQIIQNSLDRDVYRQSRDSFLEEDFYERRSTFTEASQELMGSLWNDRDSTSMQAVKRALTDLMRFHSDPVLSSEQIEEIRSNKNKEDAYLHAIDLMKASIAGYESLANELSEKCIVYISDHRHVWSNKGRQRLSMVESIMEMALADARQLAAEADGIFSDLGADKGELEQVLAGRNWENVFSEAKRVRRFEKAVNGADGDELEYEGKKYRVYNQEAPKVTQIDTGSIKKNTAAYQAAKYLGMEDAFAETFNAFNSKNGDIAILQEDVKGATLKQLLNRPVPVHYSDTAKRQMSNIAIFDVLSGYVNRGADSITAEYAHKRLADGTEYIELKSVKVKDNETAFTEIMDLKTVKAAAKFLIDINRIHYIDRRTFDAIMGLDPDELGFVLAGSGMTDESRRLMSERLDYVKDILMEKYRNNGDMLFEMPVSSMDVVEVKKTDETTGIREGGIDSMLDKASRSLDLRIKAAQTKGEKITEIEDEILVENEIHTEDEKDIDLDFQQIEDAADILMDFGEGLIYDEEKISNLVENQAVVFHMPGGDILHEKYHSQKEHMKFEGSSYYSRRAKLTEREINISGNLTRMTASEDARLLKNSMDKLQSFHTSPVLTEEQRKQIDLEDPKTFPLLSDMIRQAAGRYSALIDSLNEDIRKYTETHYPVTENGIQWINSLKKMMGMLEADKSSFMDEVDNIAYNIGAERDEIKGILEGGNWLGILSVSRSIDGGRIVPIGMGEVKGSSGTTTKYEYKGRKYFRKKNDTENGLGSPMNTVGSYRMSQLLLTDDIYVEAFRVREHNLKEKYKHTYTEVAKDDEELSISMQLNGRLATREEIVERDVDQKYGIIMEEARGKMLRELRKDKSTSGLIYSDDAKKQISRLIISDYIMGQVDRKDDNIMMDAEKRQFPNGNWCWYVKSVQAIDSDQSLIYTRAASPDSLAAGISYSPNITFLKYVDKAYYKYIMELDPDTFEKTSKYILSDIAEGQDGNSNDILIDWTSKAMKDRLIYMKNMLLKLHKKLGDKIFDLPEKAKDVITSHSTQQYTINKDGGRMDLGNLSVYIYNSETVDWEKE